MMLVTEEWYLLSVILSIFPKLYHDLLALELLTGFSLKKALAMDLHGDFNIRLWMYNGSTGHSFGPEDKKIQYQL